MVLSAAALCTLVFVVSSAAGAPGSGNSDSGTFATGTSGSGKLKPSDPPQIFPVRGPHGTRGPVGEFGAPRSGGRSHEGFDLVAPCGTPLVAARGGKVLQNNFDPILDGNEILIHARGTGRNYRYSHLRKPAIPPQGSIVRTGQRIGSVGKTGNAVTVGCHLHFEMLLRGRPVDPGPALRKWDDWS